MNPYDQVLYPTYPQAQTHPGRMAVAGRLLGMDPASLEHARVLEIGCGQGSNLIPIAFQWPGSQCVGLDLAELPIAAGRELIQKAGLNNIRMEAMDILEANGDLGEFDYIIAHGVYSWVPEPVRDKLLALCRECLVPDGIAYISYNALPGGHLRQMIRGMMLFHIREIEDRQEQVHQARALLGFLAQSMVKPDPYRSLLKAELEQILGRDESVLFHDELAGHYQPVYFHEFAAHAGRHGLQYLGEADFFEMQDSIFLPEVKETLRAISRESVVAREQYLDFLKCRKFRQTLLCRSEAELERSFRPEVIETMWIASPVVPDDNPTRFSGPGDLNVETNDPELQRVLTLLGGIWPLPLHFDDIVSRCQIERRASFRDAILRFYAANVVHLHTCAPAFTRFAPERPEVSPLARVQIELGPVVTSYTHHPVELKGDLARRFLLLLDGTRTSHDLAREMGATPEQIGQKLDQLARTALLTASDQRPH